MPPRRTDMGAEPTAPGKLRHRKVLYGRCHFPTACLEMDHMTPSSKGGAGQAGNFHLLCDPCNKLKRDRSHEHLIAELAECPVLSWN